MSKFCHYICTKRPEPELSARWGIYSPRHDRWLDVVFASRSEAEEALTVISARMSKAK